LHDKVMIKNMYAFVIQAFMIYWQKLFERIFLCHPKNLSPLFTTSPALDDVR